MAIAAVFFVPFYVGESGAYARVLREALGNIGLSLTAPSLREFFSPRLVFRVKNGQVVSGVSEEDEVSFDKRRASESASEADEVGALPSGRPDEAPDSRFRCRASSARCAGAQRREEAR